MQDRLVGDADTYGVATTEYLWQLRACLQDEREGTRKVLAKELELTVGDTHVFSSLCDIAADDRKMSVLLLLLAVLVDLLDSTLVECITADGIHRIGRIDDNAPIANDLGDVLGVPESLSFPVVGGILAFAGGIVFYSGVRPSTSYYVF